MAGYQFPMTPVTVPQVRSAYRCIRTRLPVPESLPLLRDLERYESRSMHGQYPIIWDRARDFLIHDPYGNRWIDFTSTIFVANAGHANARIKAALQETIERDLLASYTFATDIRVRYLKRLIEVTPPQLEKAFLLSSGTEATECALKLLRMYGMKAGRRHGGILSFEDSMHGRTLGAQMMGGNPRLREWIGYEDPHIHRLPFPYPWTLPEGPDEAVGRNRCEADIQRLVEQGVDPDRDLAGCLLESYIGWGAIFFPDGYIPSLVRFARSHDLIVCFDDIQGGFGRTGKMFAYQHYGVEPDLVCCGKGISSSVPLSAVLGRADLLDLPEVGSMSSTHSANPLACAAGLANIEAILAGNLVEESRRKGKILLTRLKGIQNDHPERIRWVFSRGLLAALLLADPETGAPDHLTASRVCERAMQKGLLLVHTGRESIKMGPPLTIPDAALAEGLDVLRESMEEVTQGG